MIKILFYKKWYRFLLFCRLILFSIILSLLLNPVLNISSNIEQKLDWHIYLDNSTSIKYHKTPSINSINSGLNQLNDQLLDKNISFKTFLFDEKIHSETPINVKKELDIE